MIVVFIPVLIQDVHPMSVSSKRHVMSVHGKAKLEPRTRGEILYCMDGTPGEGRVMGCCGPNPAG